jgi:hypothetical protein
VLGKRLLRRTFGRKTEKIRGGWKEFYNEELHN